MSMVSAGASYHTVDEGVARATSVYNGIAIDSNSYAWIFSSVCTTGEVVYRVNAATMPTLTGATTSSDVILASGTPCMVVGAGDKNGNMWATDGTNINYVSITAPNSVSSPVSTQAFVSGSGTGLYGPNGMAVDGSGNLWVVNKGTTATAGSAGAAEFQTNGTAGTATLLSTTGTASEGFGSDTSLYLGAPENLVIDSSGNVWFASTGGSYLYYVVGVASPVKTPLASMYGSIGSKP
jgi:hypothetical protein